MGTTRNTQKQAKADLDDKLRLARPGREILEELAVACAKAPSQDNTFQYAFCLSKSSERSELRYAVQILDGLVKEGYEHQVDCMYGAACALYLLGDYEKSRVRLQIWMILVGFGFSVLMMPIKKVWNYSLTPNCHCFVISASSRKYFAEPSRE